MSAIVEAVAQLEAALARAEAAEKEVERLNEVADNYDGMVNELQMERDAAYERGAAAMREACAQAMEAPQAVEEGDYLLDSTTMDLAAEIVRALPLPADAVRAQQIIGNGIMPIPYTDLRDAIASALTAAEAAIYERGREDGIWEAVNNNLTVSEAAAYELGAREMREAAAAVFDGMVGRSKHATSSSYEDTAICIRSLPLPSGKDIGS